MPTIKVRAEDIQTYLVQDPAQDWRALAWKNYLDCSTGQFEFVHRNPDGSPDPDSIETATRIARAPAGRYVEVPHPDHGDWNDCLTEFLIGKGKSGEHPDSIDMWRDASTAQEWLGFESYRLEWILQWFVHYMQAKHGIVVEVVT